MRPLLRTGRQGPAVRILLRRGTPLTDVADQTHSVVRDSLTLRFDGIHRSSRASREPALRPRWRAVCRAAISQDARDDANTESKAYQGGPCRCVSQPPPADVAPHR